MFSPFHHMSLLCRLCPPRWVWFGSFPPSVDECVHVQAEEEGMEANMKELQALKDGLADTQPVGHLVNCCKTLDQVSGEWTL